MKKALAFLILLLLITSILYTEEDKDYKNLLAVECLVAPIVSGVYFLVDSLNTSYSSTTIPIPLIFEYQRSISKFFSITIMPNFIFLISPEYTIEEDIENLITITIHSPTDVDLLTILGAGVSLHPFGNYLKGWFISLYPFIGTKVFQDDIYDEILYFGGALRSGYQWIFDSGFFISLSGGIMLFGGYYLQEEAREFMQDPNDSSEQVFTFLPIGVFNLGYSW